MRGGHIGYIFRYDLVITLASPLSVRDRICNQYIFYFGQREHRRIILRLTAY